MEKFYTRYIALTLRLGAFKNLFLLLIRLTLAYGFLHPAMMKWNNIEAIGEWFGSLGIPAPMLSAYMAAATEAAGVVLLALGLATRFISVPLIITMLVAIKTVHWGNGFDAGDNGFEIPLYYILMLFILLVSGAGKLSLDHIIRRAASRKYGPGF